SGRTRSQRNLDAHRRASRDGSLRPGRERPDSLYCYGPERPRYMGRHERSREPKAPRVHAGPWHSSEELRARSDGGRTGRLSCRRLGIRERHRGPGSCLQSRRSERLLSGFTSRDARWDAASAPWVSTDVTPANRYWGLAHQREPLFMPIHASWGLLGMTAFGGDKFPENMEPPYDFTHMLVTNLAPHLPSQVPPLTPMGSDFHLSIARDDRTPLGPDGTPRL